VNNEPEVGDLRVFCTVARRASFVATAAELGMSPAYVSKRIGILEVQLGIKLFHRTTRRVHLSDEGEAVYASARKVLDEMTMLRDTAASTKIEPSGLLRISTSLRLGRNHVSHALSQLERRYPKIELWLELLDRRVNLIEEDFDIDIRVGEPTQPQLVAHRIVESSRILCAAPRYIERHGEPTALADLAQHECLLFRDREQAFGHWRLQGPRGLETVKVTGRFASNHSDVVRNWGLDGHGIFLLSIWDIASSLKDGSAVRVLPQYKEPADVWAMTSSRSTSSAKVRVCVEFLKLQLTDGPFALETALP